MKTYYFLECDGRNYHADIFRGIYPDQATAVCEADSVWRHFTAGEQKDWTLILYYFSTPDEIQIDEAMDYMFDNDVEYNSLLTFSDSQRWEVCADSPEDAAKLNSVLPPMPLEDGRVLTVCPVIDED